MDLGSLKIEDEVPTRVDYFNQVDLCSSDEDFGQFIRKIEALEVEQMEAALPCLGDFAEKCPQNLNCRMEDLVLRVLKDENSSKGSRKACYSALKVGKTEKVWNDFFVLVESLEEPQFHIIRPVLTRVDELLTAVKEGKFKWKWVSIVFIRALLHSNGWIRLWALEKVVESDPKILTMNSEFIFSYVFPAINGNDLIWRLLERNHLDEFIAALGEVFREIVESSNEPENFIRSLLNNVIELSSPVSFYHVAQALTSVQKRLILSGTDVFPLYRRVLNRVSYIQFPGLRLLTCYLYVDFMVRITIWDKNNMAELGSLTAFFSAGAPELYKKLAETVQTLWKETCEKMESDQFIEELITWSSQEGDYYSIFWERVKLSGELDFVLTTLHKMIEEEQGRSIYLALISHYIYVEKTPEEDLRPLLDFIKKEIEEETVDLEILEKTYLTFVLKFAPGFIDDLTRIFHVDILKTVGTRRVATAMLVFKAFFYRSEETLLGHVKAGEDFLSPPKSDRTGLTTKEFTALQSLVQANRLSWYIKGLEVTPRSADQDVQECIDYLDCASSYSVKEALLTIICERLSSVKNRDLLLSAVNAAAAIVNEEKKSQNCLPAIEKLFQILFQKRLMQETAVVERSKELFQEFAAAAQLSQSVALILANTLSSAQEWLTADWAREVLQIAMFGPVPKKDTRVLNAAFARIYGEYPDALPDSEFEKAHEIVQRARIKAFVVAANRSASDSCFAASLTTAIIQESTILDQSSSKSFGLSLAHRQKTRVVSLLLFIMEHIGLENTDWIRAVFEHCLSCILDPCQQYSIKLVVEWILVRLCMRSREYMVRLIKMDHQLAFQRIGSIASWINIMVHLSRGTEDPEIKGSTLTAILPWSTAQNFSVRCTAIAGLTIIFNSLDPEAKEKFKYVESLVKFDSEPAGNSRRVIDNLVEDFYFSKLNMRDHLDLQTALIELPTKTGLPVEETIPMNLIEELNTTRFRSRNADTTFLEAPSLVYAALLKNASCAPDIDVVPEEEPISDQSESLQKKIITKGRVKKDDCSLIVVASLIDKPNNLGGLCRTSEIFGVNKLVIADLLMANDQGFKALSMSSEKWQKIDAVRPENLLPYLKDLRSQGYTVIAAEQTTDSIPFHKLQFPKKCVLLMGEEKAGVPTKLLRAVDQTVEIEQLGQTRSLNVHVTAALFIAKYAEQILI